MPKRLPLLMVSAVTASALFLTGCAGGGTPTPTGTNASGSCADTPSGEAVSSLEISGELGAAPTVEFASPLSTKKTEREIVIEGDGDETKPGDRVAVEFAIYSAKTGKKMAESRFTGLGAQQLVVGDAQFLAAIMRAIECVPVGSRVAVVASADDAFGDQGSSDGAIGPDESLVVVADVLSITPELASGVEQDPVDGMPTVTLDSEGKPTITIPDADAPAELQLADLKLGDGETVQDGDQVYVQYQGVIWRTGEVFDQSWGRGVADFSTSGVVKGFQAALVGQTVGSQVLVVIPPDQGYGETGNSDAGIEGTDTLVFVVDILAATR